MLIPEDVTPRAEAPVGDSLTVPSCSFSRRKAVRHSTWAAVMLSWSLTPARLVLDAAGKCATAL
jgi:hypothetical protein